MRPVPVEAHVRPALAAVGGLPDAVSDGDVRADERLAGAGPDDLRIGGRDGESADGVDRLVVEDGPPGEPGVLRLPDPAGGRTRKVSEFVAGHARDGDGAVADRTDVAEAERIDVLRGDLLSESRDGDRDENERAHPLRHDGASFQGQKRYCLPPAQGKRVESHLEVNMSALLLLVLLATVETPEQRFFEWTNMAFSKEVVRERRERMIDLLARSGGGVLLVPSRYGPSDGFTFRQLDDFLYLTGLELPDSVLVLDADEKTVLLFAPERDARYESPSRANDFPGRLLTADPDFSEGSGLSTTRRPSELPSAVRAWVEDGRKLRVDLGRSGAIPAIASDFVLGLSPAEGLLFHLQRSYPGAPVENAFDDVARLRMVKGPEEIEALRRVCELTVEAIRHAAGFVREGVDERALEGELEAAFKRGGAQRPGFASIIKSGPNSLWPWRILAANYDRRNRVMKDGELVVFDVGTELDYYVSDVGRTFPVSGRFSEIQKAKLEMITAVSDAVLAAVRPGVTFSELKGVAVAKIPEAERRYMQAGGFFGHHIGLSSGEPALPDAPLEPGMIFTVEPWYYNHDDGISVFIEDDVLVTEDGHENLTRALPRSPAELEAMTGARRP